MAIPRSWFDSGYGTGQNEIEEDCEETDESMVEVEEVDHSEQLLDWLIEELEELDD